MAKEPKKLEDFFHDTLKDIYFAEKKILSRPSQDGEGCAIGRAPGGIRETPRVTRLFGQPKLIFARTSYTSRHRKLAVSAIVRPWAISFLRSLISASDQGSPEFASIWLLS